MSVFPGSEEFANMLSKTRSFLHADHPELFYITGFHFQYWENPDEDGKYSITIKPDFVPSDHAQELEEMENRLLSLFFALVLMVGLLPLSVFATGNNYIDYASEALEAYKEFTEKEYHEEGKS